VVAKVRRSLAASKREAQNIVVEILNLRKLSEPEDRIENSNKSFTALENLNVSEDINKA
jgi:hypothetical protein